MALNELQHIGKKLVNLSGCNNSLSDKRNELHAGKFVFLEIYHIKKDTEKSHCYLKFMEVGCVMVVHQTSVIFYGVTDFKITRYVFIFA